MHVFENPFRKAIKQLKEEYTRKQQPEQPPSNERWIQDSSKKFTLPLPKFTESKNTGTLTSQVLNDYLW